MTGNFHLNGDADRLYIPRSEGGRGLKSIVRMYKSGIASVVQHLKLNKSYNTSLQFAVEQELDNIIRLKEKLLGNYEIECEKKEQNRGKNRPLSFIWNKDCYVTFECENYLSTIQDQELPIKHLRYKRVLDKGNIPNHRCRRYMINFSWLSSNVIKILSSVET